jgi:integrase
MRFRQWQAKLDPEPLAAVKIGQMPPRLRLGREFDPAYVTEQLNAGRTPEEIMEERAGTYSLLPPDALYAWARTEILKNPARFAERTGIPQIANLQDLQQPKPSPTLVSLLKLYQEKASITRHERQKSERYWREFRKIVTARTVKDITQEQIGAYYDWAMNADHSQTWVKHRLGKVKTILHFAQTRGVAPEEIDRVLSYCKILVPPRKNAADPHPITREHFQALLKAADPHWQAMLLCMLNFCMYGKEVADLDQSELDLDARTLLTDRTKTGVSRIAVVWTRTVQAIRAAPQHPQHPSLFVNRAGTRYHPDHIRRGFDRLRKAAGVPAEVKVSDLRDGAYSAAVAGGADLTHAKLLAGHQTGISDYYLRRNPGMVEDACRAIEGHYFDQP